MALEWYNYLALDTEGEFFTLSALSQTMAERHLDWEKPIAVWENNAWKPICGYQGELPKVLDLGWWTK